jgi:hypothetical protein
VIGHHPVGMHVEGDAIPRLPAENVDDPPGL